MKNYILKIPAIFSLVLLAALSAQAQIAEILPMSGGSFTMAQSVIAAGGNAQQNTLNLHGTIGQPISGASLSGNQFQHYTGFLLPDRIGQTRSAAVIGGRVLNAEGKGIRNVQVTILLANGEAQTVKTGVAGYYRFADIPIGKNYIVSVSANRFTFSRNTEERLINGDTQDIDFIADNRTKVSEDKQ